ncbi:uncharacterized protein C8Q71DRAFT_728886 [Rhodofomes roseus]|uniref:Methyltransferase family protein n=1 Tax=Rhodofomes roseus TaxID=34475 RepID=A0A4Y9XY27_9APHY|nr:uncharacterized protein C8Q71DRAFT_728886 [Rhodofomes roseus]KAH9843541.1 hypothetical protein C8Q71DRAFT_728886 [Rhodofomes roseus]TFY54692.1 hypothetical protein EVJ58_g8711 [Rhodofomes roseus]
MNNIDDLEKVDLVAPLDDKYYNLNENEKAFYKSLTGIDDDESLKRHIVSVQTEAYKVFPYPCIRWFTFARLQISRQPVYDQFIKLGKERPGAIFLEMACCFGADVRKAVADGYPVENCVATDLQPEFWELGHKLFKDSLTEFPVPFLAGDAFDQSFLTPSPIQAVVSSSPTTPPTLSDLKSLTPLAGHVSAIHATNFFHLFDEGKQLTLARALAGLLDPRPGSVIFGWHMGRPEKGDLTWPAPPGSGKDGWSLFCHCAESWREMWEHEVFKGIPVKVDAREEVQPTPPDMKLEGAIRLVWSVTRV